MMKTLCQANLQTTRKTKDKKEKPVPSCMLSHQRHLPFCGRSSSHELGPLQMGTASVTKRDKDVYRGYMELQQINPVKINEGYADRCIVISHLCYLSLLSWTWKRRCRRSLRLHYSARFSDLASYRMLALWTDSHCWQVVPHHTRDTEHAYKEQVLTSMFNGGLTDKLQMGLMPFVVHISCCHRHNTTYLNSNQSI